MVAPATDAELMAHHFVVGGMPREVRSLDILLLQVAALIQTTSLQTTFAIVGKDLLWCVQSFLSDVHPPDNYVHLSDN